MNCADELLAAFGQSTGLGDASFDDQRTCTLKIDDLAIEIDSDDEGNLVALSCFLEEVTREELPMEWYEALLRANFFQLGTRGGTLGYDPGSRLVTFVHRQRVVGMPTSEFQEWIESFTSTAESWKARLSEILSGEPQSLATPSPSPFAFKV